MPAEHIIKRYPNRRLYDTHTSQYITLDEVQALVLKQIKFKVIEHDTGEDLTSYILLQIISEQEKGHFPIFTSSMLENIIRFYGSPIQKNISAFLESCFSGFNQATSTEKPHIPFFDALATITQQNITLWQTTLAQYIAKNPPEDKKNDT